MEISELLTLVEQLEDNIEDLEESLEPLFATALSATTKKLPVLDRAKLHVLVVYSIESLLFSFLRLNGVQAKEHSVFRELTRVKQYFAKLTEAETGGVKPRENISLNKQATGRIIKHALAGNDKFDSERAEREAREKLLAARKLKSLELSMKMKAQQVEQTAAEDPALEEGEVYDDGDEEMPDSPSNGVDRHSTGKQSKQQEIAPQELAERKARNRKRKDKRKKKAQKKVQDSDNTRHG